MNELETILYAAYDPATGEVTQSGNMARNMIEYLARENNWTWVQLDKPLDYRKTRIDPETKKPVDK